MKYTINKLEAVRDFYTALNAKPRIRYYANGKEVAKAAAVEFTVSGVDVEYVEPVKTTTTRKERTGTKAEVIRMKIKELLAVESFDAQEVVDFAVEALGMKKPLATVYVKNSLAKVKNELAKA